MYVKGDGGPKDPKKAMALWTAAEKAGDPLVSILVADQLFSNMTGGRKPGPGRYGFKGGIPVADIEVVEEWYKQAQARDPRPEVQQRAKYALAILASFKKAAKAS
jgi:TPR repeat protein